MYHQAPVPCTTWTCNPVVLPVATLSCRHRFRSRTRTITRRPTAHPRCPRPLIRFTPALIYTKDHICPAAEPTPAAKPTSHVTSALPHSPVNNTKSVHPLPSLISCLVYHLSSCLSSLISCHIFFFYFLSLVSFHHAFLLLLHAQALLPFFSTSMPCQTYRVSSEDLAMCCAIHLPSPKGPVDPIASPFPRQCICTHTHPERRQT